MFILLAISAVFLLAVVGTALGIRLMLNRRNRVVAGVKSPAPLSWLSSSRKEAKLHRRLGRAARRLALVPPTDDVADVITRLRIELVELDGHLVTVARRPTPARRADRTVIQERVERIEALVRRVEERSRTEVVSLDELTERLDLLDAADSELNELGPTDH
ncbi:MAG: hypothetical protein ACI9C1_003375 [Candidatus Aldehydirespiratoraceae bacterium]